MQRYSDDRARSRAEVDVADPLGLRLSEANGFRLQFGLDDDDSGKVHGDVLCDAFPEKFLSVTKDAEDGKGEFRDEKASGGGRQGWKTGRC